MIQFEEPAQVLSNPPSKMSEVNRKQTKVQQRYNVRYVEAQFPDIIAPFSFRSCFSEDIVERALGEDERALCKA